MATARHAELVSGLERLATRVTAEAGLELVEVSLRGSSRRRVVRVDIDRAGPDGVGLQDCQRVSEALGLELDREELLHSGYTLEVSSPGIDRPIRTPDEKTSKSL